MSVCERCTENHNCAWQNHEETICHDRPAFPLTNADRIRAMTDEELADELLEWYAVFSAVEWTKDMILGWLKQEANDGK